jgi:hypothetical protein
MNNREPLSWSKKDLSVIRSLTTPAAVQRFLDSIPYSTDKFYRCPKAVARDRTAHCFDGAVFAAAMLRRIGHAPLIVDMQAVRDDDHVIAIFKRNGKFGAVAKSNFVGLRFREPIHRDIRELVMTYFPSFYNMNGEYSLRQFTVPLDLSLYDRLHWEFVDEPMEEIGLKLSYIPVTKLMTPAEIRSLQKVDRRTFKAGMIGAIKKGIYFPDKHE